MKDLYSKYIEPELRKRIPKRLIEVGVLHGGLTLHLLRYCKAAGAHLTSVEPVAWEGTIPDEYKKPAATYDSKILGAAITPTYIEEAQKENLLDYWTCIKATSFEYFSSDAFIGADAYFLDGDHNYFTMLSDLKLIHRKAKKGDIILMHDVVKWGYRDQYYDPDSIPPEFLYGTKQGIVTAINDFVRNTRKVTYPVFESGRLPFLKYRRIPMGKVEEKRYRFTTITRTQYGLGCLERL